MSDPEYIELNLRNFDDDDACQLNEWSIWAIGRIEELEKQNTDTRDALESLCIAMTDLLGNVSIDPASHAHEMYHGPLRRAEAVIEKVGPGKGLEYLNALNKS